MTRTPAAIIAAALALALPAAAEAACQLDRNGLTLCSAEGAVLPSPADRRLTDTGHLDLSPDPLLPGTLPDAPQVGDRIEDNRYSIIHEPSEYGLPSVPEGQQWVAADEEILRITADNGYVIEVLPIITD